MSRWEAVHDWLEAQHRRSLFVSIAFVGVAGLGYCVWLGVKLRFDDEKDYVRIAGNLARSGSYSGNGGSAYRPPGYPLLLGAMKWIGAPIWVMRSMNVVFLAVVVGCAWWLARRIGGRAAAAVAAPLVAVYPIGFYTMGTLYPQTMGAAMLLVGIVALVGIRESPHRYLRAAVTGVIFGALILTVPTFAVALVVAVVWLLIADRKVWTVVLLVGIAALLPLAWTARNYHTMHAFVPISTNNGFNLLLGNSEHAGPRTGVKVDVSSYTQRLDQRHLDEVAADRYLRTAALHWITHHPVRAGVLYVEKTANYFAPYDQLGTEAQSSRAQQVVAVLTYLPLLALFVLRLLRWRRDRPDDVEWLLIVLYLISAPVEAVFFTRVRFRDPLDPLLIVVVAGMIGRWPGRVAGDRTPEFEAAVDSGQPG
jgi:4-amino-4-deoxy-L-arabinose transferase-like glycosyltransferase